jgi:hypothetical protein
VRRSSDALGTIQAFDHWLTTWRRTAPDARRVLVSAGEHLAEARRGALKTLIQTDPQAALLRAVPAGLRAELPAEIQSQLEARIDARGNFEVNVACFGRHEITGEPTSHLHRNAVIEGNRYTAHVFGRRAQQLTKYEVPLHGIAVDGLLALDENPFRPLDDGEKHQRGIAADQGAILIGAEVRTFAAPEEWERIRASLIAAESAEGPYLQAAAGAEGEGVTGPARAGVTRPLSWTLGDKRLLWITVSFADDPTAPFSVAQIEAAALKVAAHYRAVSRGRVNKISTITPVPLQLPQPKAYYNREGFPGELHTAALALARSYDAANGGNGTYDPARYDRYIVVFKSMSNYNFGGVAALGGSNVLMNGNLRIDTLCHELGHTHSLPHADWWRAMDGTSLNGAFKEYGDLYDVMGNANDQVNVGYFNTTLQAKLGYLDNTTIQTVTTNGRYRLFGLGCLPLFSRISGGAAGRAQPRGTRPAAQRCADSVGP